MTDVFWLNKADFQPVAKVASKEEMVEALKKAPKSVVTHHITASRNDFVNWAKFSLKNFDLAAKLAAIRREDPQALDKLISAFSGAPAAPIAAAAPAAMIKNPGFPSTANELSSNAPHPQADALRRQSEMSSNPDMHVSPFNLKKKR